MINMKEGKMRKDIITMSRRELRRLPVIHKVMEKRLTQMKAAEMIDLSDRQIRRIICRIKTYGDSAIVHGNRGKKSPFKLSEERTAKIMVLLRRGIMILAQRLPRKSCLNAKRLR